MLSQKSTTRSTAPSGARDAQRMYALYILSVLKANSNEQHPMSLSQIRDELEKTFFSLHGEKAPNIKTIRNQLSAIVDSLNIWDPSELSESSKVGAGALNTDAFFRLGFRVIRCVKNPNWKKAGASGSDTEPEYIEYDPDSEEAKASKPSKSKTLYFYYKSIFEDSEISMLIEALEAYNYLSIQDITALVVKLSELNPRSMEFYRKRRYPTNPDPRLTNQHAYLLENLRTLYAIIQNRQFAEITNSYYDIHHELSSYQLNSDPPERLASKTVRPLRLMFNNGYYYLIAQQYSSSKKKYFTVHYRIDRLADIIPREPTAEELQDYQAEPPLDAAAYRLQHPVMFGDDMTEVEMLVANTTEMLNLLMDTFGSLADISIRDKGWLTVKAKASIGGMKLIAKEYCGKMYVVSPISLAQDIMTDLQKAFKGYEGLFDPRNQTFDN